MCVVVILSESGERKAQVWRRGLSGISGRITCFCEHIPVVRLEGTEVKHAQANNGEDRIHDEDNDPRVEERLGKDTLLLLLDVVRRSLKTSNPEHRSAETKQDREGPVILQGLPKVIGKDLRVLHHVYPADEDEEDHRGHVHKKDSECYHCALGDAW
jgi:hypothetical protein